MMHRAIVSALLIAIAGCTLIGPAYPTDFKLTSVKAVRQQEVESDLSDLSGDPNMVLVMLELQSSADIEALAYQNNFNTHARFSLCLNGQYDDAGELRSWPKVYDRYGEINPLRNPRSSRAAQQFGPISYRAYFFFMSNGADTVIQTGKPPSPIYDLAKLPQDICVWVGGGNMLGGHYQSNTVIVPAQDIAKALAEAGIH